MNDFFEIRQIGRDNAEIMLALFNEVFNRKEGMVFWETKHYKNPVGDTLFWGAFYNDELVSMNGFMPLKYILKGKTLLALESCESATKNEYRHKGLFSRIIQEAEKWAYNNGYDFMMGLPNMFSYPGFMKIGWETIGEAHSYARVVKLSGWVKEKNRPLANGLQIANCFRNAVAVSNKSEYELQETDSADLEEILKDIDVFHCYYTKDFIEWKKEIKSIKLYKLYCNGNAEMLAMINKDSISFLRFINDGKEHRDKMLRFFCDNVFEGTSIIKLCVDHRLIDPKAIFRAGFITKRELPYYRIVKRLSPNVSDQNVFDDLVIQDLEVD